MPMPKKLPEERMVGMGVSVPRRLADKVRSMADAEEISISTLTRRYIEEGIAAAESRGDMTDTGK